ncbi:hypothetical protein StoSoilB3_43230 (plasmid) [Arthrobacter sp. StoSoilB3]|nr:hypothetical protein StoSoilB3_43230 [Arthrobacter sp. StoSoilB3]
MGEIAPKRVALMSIRPEFAHAILAGTKTVEFRKRPVAVDVTHVLVYATMPVGLVLGWFSVQDQSTKSPKDLWKQFGRVGGIAKDRFFAYYDQRTMGTGIIVGEVGLFADPLPLTELGQIMRPPQSFQYLTDIQIRRFVEAASLPSHEGDWEPTGPKARTAA